MKEILLERGDVLRIGDDVAICFEGKPRGQPVFSIDAPKSIKVLRAELLYRDTKKRRVSAER